MYNVERALENQDNKIEALESMLKAMESDFAECARTRKSPCFFCANDDTCDCQSCNFKWMPHN